MNWSKTFNFAAYRVVKCKEFSTLCFSASSGLCGFRFFEFWLVLWGVWHHGLPNWAAPVSNLRDEQRKTEMQESVARPKLSLILSEKNLRVSSLLQVKSLLGKYGFICCTKYINSSTFPDSHLFRSIFKNSQGLDFLESLQFENFIKISRTGGNPGLSLWKGNTKIRSQMRIQKINITQKGSLAAILQNKSPLYVEGDLPPPPSETYISLHHLRENKVSIHQNLAPIRSMQIAEDRWGT